MVVLPLSLMTVIVGREIVAGVDYVRETVQSEGVRGLIDDLPRGLRTLADRVVGELPRGERQIEELARNQTGRAAAAVGGVLVATSHVLFQIVIMLIAFYFLLVDGPALVDWLCGATPLTGRQCRELLRDFRAVSVAVVVSSFATAGIQALVALAGFLLVRAPQPVFFTLVTFFAGFIPAVGAGSVVVAVALFVYASGNTGGAVFLALWGALAVGFSDNVVKPLLMRGRLEVHTALIFFALLGGVALFGPVGLVVGPLGVAFFLAVVRMCRRDLHPREVAEAGERHAPRRRARRRAGAQAPAAAEGLRG
jgi:predicted PurR-regulated permease PerM